MDRVVRFSLFALGIFVGSFVISVSQSDESEDMPSEGPVKEADAPLPEPDWAELELLQREKSERRVARMTAAATREPVDPDWGPVTERQIAERFVAKGPPGFELLSATCKTSLCIAEIQAPSREQSTQQLAWSEFLGLSRGFVHHRADDQHRTVVFLAREGHSLPK